MKYRPRLILMSYWRTVFKWLIKHLKENDIEKIAYIMNAVKADVAKNSTFIFNDADALRAAGFQVEVVNLDNAVGIEEKLKDFDAIYVRGGNTFDLLESVRESGFDELLPKLLEEGKIYVSSSAGSILPGPNLELALNDFMTDENNAGLEDFRGLGIVPFAVFPHFIDEYNKNLDDLKIKMNIDYPVVKLKDNQVALVEGVATKILDIDSDKVIGDKIFL